MRKLFLSALFLLPVLILLPHLGEFAFQPGAQYSDMLISHYPNALFLQKTLREQGVLPLWSPAILSGYPFVANPLSGIAYLPGWLALFLPLPLGLNLMLVLHLVWGGTGMYLFLRGEGFSEIAALMGALIYESMPKLYGHLGAGHLSLVYAVAWTPWLLYFENRSRAMGRFGWLWSGVILGTLALADVRWFAYAGLLWLAYSLRLYLRQPGRLRLVLTWAITRLSNLAMAGLVAAPLLLPLAQYTRLSTRGLITVEENLTLSLPASQLLGLAYPNIGGPAEWLVYPGAVTLALVIAALLTPRAPRQAAFWFGLVVVSLVYALGDAVPLLDWVARLPGMSLLRVPPRALLLTGFGMSVLAAQAMRGLSGTPVGEFNTPGSRTRLFFFAAAAFIGLFAAVAWFFVNQPLARLNFTWGAFFFSAGSLLIWFGWTRRLQGVWLPALLLSASLIDLIGVNGLSLAFTPVEQALAPGRAAAEYIAAQSSPDSFRVYSPSYSIPQQAAAKFQLQLADGVDPLQLITYRDFMTRATGVPEDGYSVTLPPYPTARPDTDNRHSMPDPRLLGLLSVRYVAAEFPLHNDQLRFLAEFGKTRVYQNLAALPRAWVQPAGSEPGQDIRSIPFLTHGVNEINARAAGPGLLVLSEIAYPGWQVRVDGQLEKLITVSGLLRGVEIPGGEHSVVFTFRPLPFFIGLGLACLGWAICAGLGIAMLRRPESAPSHEHTREPVI